MFCGEMSRWTIPSGAALVIGLRVRVIERVRDTGDHVGRQLGRETSALAAMPLEDRAEVLPGDVLHRDVVRVFTLTELVGLRDVGVRKLRADLGFINEHVDEVTIFGDGREDPLDGDEAGLRVIDEPGLEHFRPCHRR